MWVWNSLQQFWCHLWISQLEMGGMIIIIVIRLWYHIHSWYRKYVIKAHKWISLTSLRVLALRVICTVLQTEMRTNYGHVHCMFAVTFWIASKSEKIHQQKLIYQILLSWSLIGVNIGGHYTFLNTHYWKIPEWSTLWQDVVQSDWLRTSGSGLRSQNRSQLVRTPPV